MAKKIEVTPEVRAKLVEEYELPNDRTVYNALNYSTESPSAKMIRRKAVELGGVQWVTLDEVARELEQELGTVEQLLGTSKAVETMKTTEAVV